MRMSTTRETLAAKYRSQSKHSHKRVETAVKLREETTRELAELVTMLKDTALFNALDREIQEAVEANWREAVEFEPMLGDVAFLKDMGLS